MNKSYLGAEIQITPKMQTIVQAFAKIRLFLLVQLKRIILRSLIGMLTLNLWCWCHHAFLNNSPDPDQYSAIYINDFPGFDNHGTDHRIPALWMYGPCPGGYDHYEYEPFFKIAFEGN